MAKRKKAQPWDAVFANVATGRSPDRIRYPLVTEAQLDEAETRLGSRFPASYRAFMTQFGPGVIAGVWLLRPIVTPVGASQPVQALIEHTTHLREVHHDNEWMARCVYFAYNCLRDPSTWECAWDPVEVTRVAPHECRLCDLNPLSAAGLDSWFGSFDEFLTWVAEESWLRGGSECNPDSRGVIWHDPLTLRLALLKPY